MAINPIRDTPGLAILIASASGITVRNNRIVDANTQPFDRAGAAIDAEAHGAIMVTRASEVRESGNRITSTRPVHDGGIYVDKRNTRDVVARDNYTPPERILNYERTIADAHCNGRRRAAF